MKVGELIKELQKLRKPDLEVIVSSDEEGNSFSPLADFSLAKWNKTDREIDTEEKPANAVVFWP